MPQFGEASVKELAEPFDMTLPAVTKHRKVLQCGVGHAGAEGAVVALLVHARPLREVSDWVEAYRQFWDEKLRDNNVLINEF